MERHLKTLNLPPSIRKANFPPYFLMPRTSHIPFSINIYINYYKNCFLLSRTPNYTTITERYPL